MTEGKLYHTSTNKVLLTNLCIPDSFFAKAKGLIGKKSLDENQGLWLKPCSSIHTFFMSIDIDVIYLNRNMVIQKIDHRVRPWRLPMPSFRSHSVIEIKAGQAQKHHLKKGDTLYVGS